jgi:hypothetical protein
MRVIEEFDGHLEQIDYHEGMIKRLHLVGRYGHRLLVTIDAPEMDTGLDLDSVRDRPLVFLARDARPIVRIERDLRP